ncbi:MAG: bifunctional diaminohydroxyphosphoribosylaminopyrimidine deaminase/5-amino-6-(5-phosphoribosylamino)uracil reductase RibD [Phycisphaerales bacterium JB040]
MDGATHRLSEAENADAKRWLHVAARAGARGFGDVEPNPMVGCAIVKGGALLALGHHRRFGGPHAEREALDRCRTLGRDPSGSTVYVTLEPCRHTGKQPPCSRALIEAGVARVVAARPDPGEISGGGFIELASAGIETAWVEWGGPERGAALAWRLSDPFVTRERAGRAWVIAKWAQTLDGKIATRTGASQWISSERSRARVHRLRGRVDAVLTGIGTVLADDPMLNARPHVPPGSPLPEHARGIRRVARRVVVDTALRLPADSLLARSADEYPTTVYAGVEADGAGGAGSRGAELVSCGVEVVEGLTDHAGRPDLALALADLWARYRVATVLVEAGPRLLGSLVEAGLVDEAVVYVAPVVVGDERGRSAAEGRVVEALADARRFRLVNAKRIGDDLELVYRGLTDA